MDAICQYPTRIFNYLCIDVADLRYYDVGFKKKEDVVNFQLHYLIGKNLIRKTIPEKENRKFQFRYGLFCSDTFYNSKRPLAPQGSTNPFEETGSPISSSDTFPRYFFKAVFIM